MSGKVSVIIPAHNEEASLPDSLNSLLAGVAHDEVEVVVVANGCTDRTAEAARRVAAETAVPVNVVEIPTAGKTIALNAGDDVATVFPRIYLDADVRCATTTLQSLVAVLRAGSYELAVPTRRLDLSHATWWTRQYYRTWQGLPRVRAELSGRGAYGFSLAGRRRFGRFPAITADDFWAVRQVLPDRVAVVPEVILIRPPGDLRTLVRVRSRIYAANRATGVTPTRRRANSTDVSFLLRHPRLWLGAGVFLATNAYIKVIGVRCRREYGRDATRGAGPMS